MAFSPSFVSIKRHFKRNVSNRLSLVLDNGNMAAQYMPESITGKSSGTAAMPTTRSAARTRRLTKI
jgi:hypothetical protein